MNISDEEEVKENEIFKSKGLEDEQELYGITDDMTAE